MNERIFLGIETSCDETAAALVTSDRRILAERVQSQLDAHAPYGGVVPEIAARAHAERLDGLIAACMDEALIGFADLAGIAATAGPGLIGGLTTGLAAGKTIAMVHDLPFFAINHLEGHALTARLTNTIGFPYALFLASGGHCQILICRGPGNYIRLGTTLDDALGEAYDKIAKMMGLGYPGGPAVERRSRTGNPARFDFPRSMVGRNNCHFSFSGLKASVRRTLIAQDQTGLVDTDIDDVCASFEAAVSAIVTDRLSRALKHPAAQGIHGLVVAGGVAANQKLRASVQSVADTAQIPMIAPPIQLCGDNATMIAWAAIERDRLGLHDDLTSAPLPRWPLDPSAEPAPGAGIKA